MTITSFVIGEILKELLRHSDVGELVIDTLSLHNVTYSGFSSIPINGTPSSAQATHSLPDPANGITQSSDSPSEGFLADLISFLQSANGFCVG